MNHTAPHKYSQGWATVNRRRQIVIRIHVDPLIEWGVGFIFAIAFLLLTGWLSIERIAQ